jgi:hypothetical protein
MGNTPLHVDVTVDPRTKEKTVAFSRPVSGVEASQFLFGNKYHSNLLRPVGSAFGSASRFLLDTGDAGVIWQLRPEVRSAVIYGGVIRSTGDPIRLQAWIPDNIKQDIYRGKLKNGVTRFPGSDEWGDIVVWKDGSSVQVYQEFPASEGYYARISSSNTQAHLLHHAYSQYNRDMSYFVEQKGLSPDDARSELRRINDEVFRLVLEGAAAILNNGAGISQVNNTIKASADRVAAAAQRSPRLRSSTPAKAGATGIGLAKVKPLNGRVNVGGGGGAREPSGMTNLNPAEGIGGGPTKEIANHVRGKMEQMEQLFEPNSVELMVSSKLRYGDVNWDQATKAAAKVMRRGGKVEMNVWCYSNEKDSLVAAFVAAGFKNVRTEGDAVGTMLYAVW